ncbi:DUF4405 domain-containing protein [Shewanella avicenniae]|uniref:DUF4405 domain-containing protein n=1 Tax=Shewanella avicenniae TaxID=2814294 RepID=A0ABX7QNL4_9GAMM|nr:DUF4405 domain-containing protein [Shewanella avicenniae]QSX33061.1 DUF4405 domain-containing protein [Shewanella avicenniae]
MFRAKMRHWSTPLVIGTSVVVGVSGVMLFFHLSEGLVKLMHEWLGMAFVVATLFHILNHWGPFKRYFSEKIAAALMIVVLLVAGAFIYNAANNDNKGHPVKLMMDLVMNSPLTAVAQLQQQPVTKLISDLEAKGIHVDNPAQTIAQLAKANKQHPFALLGVVTDGALKPPQDAKPQAE